MQSVCLILISWIVIYPVDSAIQRLNNQGQGYLTFTWENWKFRLENQMVRAILFGNLQKIWAVF